MPERSKIENDELDDDDEDGSKGEDEEVVAFDEYRDLPPQQNMRAKTSPSKPSGYSPTRGGERKKGAGGGPPEDLDTPDALNHVGQVTGIPWPAAAGKRPPRDMKRLVPGEWYIVCKVMKWGDTPALFVRASRDFTNDNGFYKPPAQYYTYQFQIGDRLQLSQVGYSSSRNKVATSIRVKPTHMSPVPESKMQWVPPPIQDLPASEPKAKKKNVSNDGDSDDRGGNSQKRKKQKEEPPAISAIRVNFGEHSPMIQPFSPLGMPNHHQQHGKKDKQLMYPIFQHQTSFGPGSGGLGTTLMSGGNLFAFPSTPDLGLPRGQSFSFVNDLLGTASSANLMAPQSPIMGPNSPLMGHQPGMHRIPSIGGSIGGPLGSFSINSPSTQLTLNYAFPSHANFGATTDHTNGI
jgi:hypothetical protein